MDIKSSTTNILLIHSWLQDQTPRVQPDDQEGEDHLSHLPEGNPVQLRQHLGARLLQAQNGGEDVVPEGVEEMTINWTIIEVRSFIS